MSTKVIKPYYNVRVANNLQRTALEVAENAKQLQERQEAEIKNIINERTDSTFSRMKNTAARRRQMNNKKKISFQESLSYLVSKAAYTAMPVDGKKPLIEGASLQEQPKEFQRMFEAVGGMITKDSSICSAVGDAYSRCSGIDLGSSSNINASQFAVTIAGRVNPVAEKLSDNPDPSSFTAMNHVDALLYFGDTAGGLPKDSDEAIYENFITSLADTVEKKVLHAIREESQRAEMSEFLQEAYQDELYGKTSNRLLARKVKKVSVFQEVTMSVFAKNMSEGEFTKEEMLGEAIAHYTILETFNAIDLLKKTPEQIISECVAIRSACRKI